MTKLNVTALYDTLHAMPELGMQEHKTAAYLAGELEKLGYEVTRNVGGTGVVGVARGAEPGLVMLVRADMDALPFKRDGKDICVHACGHDAHSAMVLAAAAELQDKVRRGTLKILFQPGEETLRGALAVIEAGAIDDVDIALGVHVRPIQDASLGQLSPAVKHASSYVMDVVLHGRAAHGARPHLGVNAIDAAASVVQAVNSIHIDPVVPFSVKVTNLSAGTGASNIIPDKATLVIDMRAQTNAAMDELMKKTKTAVARGAEAVGATSEISVRGGVPAAELDEALTEEVAEVIAEVVGKENLIPALVNPGGEDFHYFIKHKPSLKPAYFGVGCDLKPGLHDLNMSFNKSALQNGVDVIVKMVLRKLG